LTRRITLAELRRLYATHTIAEMVEITGIPSTTIWRRLRVSGGTRGRAHHARRSYTYPPLTYDVLRQVQTMYVEQEMSTNQIADALGVSRTTVSQRLRKAGVHIRGRDEAIRLRVARDARQIVTIEKELR